MNLEEINKRLDDFLDYQKLKLDIIYSDFNRWTGNAKHQLPSFNYFLENCIKDKGGKYDFSKQNYKTHQSTITKQDNYCFHTHYKLPHPLISIYFIHSCWMGTPFNFKQITTIK